MGNNHYHPEVLAVSLRSEIKEDTNTLRGGRKKKGQKKEEKIKAKVFPHWKGSVECAGGKGGLDRRTERGERRTPREIKPTLQESGRVPSGLSLTKQEPTDTPWLNQKRQSFAGDGPKVSHKGFSTTGPKDALSGRGGKKGPGTLKGATRQDRGKRRKYASA